MKNTVLVELKNENALNLLYDLEKLDILQIIKDIPSKKIDIASKFIGVISKEQGQNLRDHIKSSREEWEIHT